MDTLRYIPTIEASGPKQMAIDEAILRCYDKGSTPPTLRFFRFSPSAITVGYAQDIDTVINTDKCKELGIPYIRRITGGGTVYHDYDGEVTYSIVTDRMTGAIEDSFHHLLKPLISTLIDHGLDAVFKPYNDILVNSKKISGSAQRRARRGMLQHGTLMYGTDLETLSEILKLDMDKLKARGADSFMDLVTTMEDELGYDIEPEELIEELRSSYKERFGVRLETGELTDEEKELANELEEKYSSDPWTLNRKWKR